LKDKTTLLGDDDDDDDDDGVGDKEDEGLV
jgi:hypothetical protein